MARATLALTGATGFVTEPSLVKPNSVNDPTGFFTAVVENDYKCGPALLFRDDLSTYSSTGQPERQARYTKPTTCQLCACTAGWWCLPHVYPPTITFAKSAFTGPAFWARMSYSFGYFSTVRPLLPHCAAPSLIPACATFSASCGVFGCVAYLGEDACLVHVTSICHMPLKLWVGTYIP